MDGYNYTEVLNNLLNVYSVFKGAQNDDENLQFAREANETNIALTREQNQLNRESQERVNAENTASAERLNQMNLALAERTNAQNQALQRETNAQNLAIANQNLQFQRDNLEYQKQLQNKIFEREDNQYQRTVSDMEKAGMSPLAMSGLNGAGETVGTTALTNGMNYGMTPNQAPQGNALATKQATKYEKAQVEKLVKGQAYLNALGKMSDNLSQVTSNQIRAKEAKEENIKWIMLQNMNLAKFSDEQNLKRDNMNASNAMKNALITSILKIANKESPVDAVQEVLNRDYAKTTKEMAERLRGFYYTDGYGTPPIGSDNLRGSAKRKTPNRVTSYIN